MNWETIIMSFVTTLIVAPVSALITFWGYWRKAKAELQREYESRFSQRKWDTYVTFASLVFRLVTKRTDTDVRVNQLVELAEGTFPNIWLVASEEIIEAFVEMSSSSDIADKERIAMKILQAMRKDLGGKPVALSEKDLLAVVKGRGQAGGVVDE